MDGTTPASSLLGAGLAGSTSFGSGVSTTVPVITASGGNCGRVGSGGGGRLTGETALASASAEAVSAFVERASADDIDAPGGIPRRRTRRASGAAAAAAAAAALSSATSSVLANGQVITPAAQDSLGMGVKPASTEGLSSGFFLIF
ncbi:unnamed protein product [Protopolystoma xenopodis]|uniref:Uncharacterized protein n=1 Tax=Protopolystoma xenopodis TaxID=117903 RepID=A0A448X2L8_9PLAT|nr:unnamed protein product [Protopolystoma xenopodis]